MTVSWALAVTTVMGVMVPHGTDKVGNVVIQTSVIIATVLYLGR